MRRIGLPVAFLVLAASLAHSERKTDLQNAGLSGPVESIESFVAQYVDRQGSWVEGTRLAKQSLRFDRQGNVVEETTYDPRGNLYLRKTSTHRSDGAKTEEVIRNATGSVVERYAFRLSAKGDRIAEENYSYDGSLAWKSDYSYDEKGNLIKETVYGADGSVSSTRRIRYNERGQKVEETVSWADGLLTSMVTYADDPRGSWTEELSYHKADGTVSRRESFSHDANGRLVGWAIYRSDGSLIKKAVYAYDVRGNMTDFTDFGPDGSISEKGTYTYEFDNNGNWTRKVRSAIVLRNGEVEAVPVEVEYRGLTYYSD